MASLIGGFKDKKIETRSKVEPSTVQYIGENRQGLDVVSQTAYRLIGSDAVEANSTTSLIVATAHSAKVGDVVKFTSGVLDTRFAFIQETATNSITLSQTLNVAPSAADTFQIWRPGILAVNDAGEIPVTLTLPAGISTAANQVIEQGLLTTIDADTSVLQATGSSSQQIQGADAVSATPTAKPVTIGMKEFFTGTVQHPHCITSAGVNYQLMIVPDLSLNFLAYTSTGEIRNHGFSTNGLASGSKYGLVDSSGRIVIKNGQTSSAATTSVSGSATSVTLLASNTSRVGATIFNDSTATLYLKLGATASTTSFVTKLYTDQYYEVPFGYTGIIDGIWSSATGSARIVELT